MYRKDPSRFDDWHFHPDCPSWPKAGYVEKVLPPTKEALCLDCVDLYDRGYPNFDLSSLESSLFPSRKILIVEDEELLLEALQDVLKKEGYDVLAARDGEEALAIFERQKENITLVILDLGLPKISGISVFQKMMSERPGLKVITVTGYLGDMKEQLLEAGALDFIPKPYQTVDILEKVRKFSLDSSSSH